MISRLQILYIYSICKHETHTKRIQNRCNYIIWNINIITLIYETYILHTFCTFFIIVYVRYRIVRFTRRMYIEFVTWSKFHWFAGLARRFSIVSKCKIKITQSRIIQFLSWMIIFFINIYRIVIWFVAIYIPKL